MTENPKGAQEGCSEAGFDGRLPSWPRISRLRTDESPSAGRPRAEWLVGGGQHDGLDVAYAGAVSAGSPYRRRRTRLCQNGGPRAGARDGSSVGRPRWRR